MSFTHDDVQRIIQLLDASHFDELHLEAEGIKLDLRRNSAAPSVASDGPVASARATSSAGSQSPAPTTEPVSPSAGQKTASGEAQSATHGANKAGLHEIKAPMLGTFYRAPKPGADPFITEGSKVDPDTVVGIIEVMKLMNSVPAKVTGEVVEVVAQDGDLVEYDQVLFRVRP